MHLASLGAVAALPLLARAAVPHGRQYREFARSDSSSSIASPSVTSSAIPNASGSHIPIINLAAEPVQAIADVANWTTVTECSAAIAGATQDPQQRWAAAGASGAWKDLVGAWITQGPSGGLDFPAFASNFFAGPDNWKCRDIGDTACSTMLTCNQVNHPAGYLILNSFSSIHQLHAQYYRALGGAMNHMQNYIGQFASIFSPQKQDDTTAIKILLDAIVMVTTVSSSAAWGLALPEIGKSMAKVADKLPVNQAMGLGGRLATIYSQNTALYGFSKDVMNGAINSFAIAAAKDSLKSSSDPLGTQNDLSVALGDFFSEWQAMESDYVKTLFAGTNDESSLGALGDLIDQGIMLLLPSSDLDLSGLTALAEQIMYAKMIPAAWQEAPAGLHPVILREEGACDKSIDQDMLNFMDQDTLTGGYVCYNDDAYYVVNAQKVTTSQSHLGLQPNQDPFAVWPQNHGDVYFGEENCLYDSTGSQIYNQCCMETTTDSVVNPYYNS